MKRSITTTCLLLLVSKLIHGSKQKLLQHVSDLSDLKYDENDRLRYHYLAVAGEPGCSDVLDDFDFAVRQPAVLNGNAASDLFKNERPAVCSFACLEKGTQRKYVTFPLEKHRFASDYLLTSSEAVGHAREWYADNCQKIEIGFVLYGDHDADLFWISHTGENVPNGVLRPKEEGSEWRDTYIGHKFKIVQRETNKILGVYAAEYNAVYVVLPSPPPSLTDSEDFIVKEIYQTLQPELVRAHDVKRTFTEFGFGKGRMPDDLWSSINTYYYNNRNHKFLEEWDYPEMFVNWWEANVYMIAMPWGLKRYWQSRLHSLVEAWSGTKLELTDIYGMREYQDGARLLTHADRIETHAASLIINVAQGDIREPWKLEIYDHADRLHEVTMEEGDIVYYESARCLHGRMKPLQGAFYVNLFSHYRPIGEDGRGDPLWYKKLNPEGTVEPVLDIGECTFDEKQQPHCVIDKDAMGNYVAAQEINAPYLSPLSQQLTKDDDLFNYWKQITDSITHHHLPQHAIADQLQREEL